MTIKNKIKDLAATYNTFGLDSAFSKEAEKLSGLNYKQIYEAKELSAMSRYVI
ncbi:hypothetical protein [Paenibacillus taichungensis]